MRISEMLGQYNKNITSNSSDELQSAQSSGKMVSTFGELETGTIFEGTVSNIKNGRVMLSLSNGQTISARLDGKINLSPGDSMFFQVRSNDGNTVAIKPYTTESGVNNPILLNALSAAGVPANERSVAMVDVMMKEQMSIGKQSILDMVRVLNSNPDVKVSTLVQMTKVGLPISIESAAQFENYQADSYAIMGDVDEAIGQVLWSLGGENLQAEDAFLLYSNLLDIVTGDPEAALQEGMQTGELTGEAAETLQGEAATTGEAVAGEAAAETITGEAATSNATTSNPIPSDAMASNGVAADIMQEIGAGQQETVQGQDASETAQTKEAAGEVQRTAVPQTIDQLLDEGQVTHLKHLLQNIPTLTGNTELFGQPEEVFVDTMSEDATGAAERQIAEKTPSGFQNVEFQKNMTAEEFLQTVRNAIAQNSQYGFSGVSKLFASREFQTLLRNVIEKQWTMRPEEVTNGEKVSQFYEKMERQMNQIEHAMQLAGATENSFSASASQVQSNVEFMNQMNQIYTYVQIPLKLTGQNTSGELYVYTNKKNLSNPDAELTAFLHLDLEHLGSTDVSVKMLRKNVDTRFYIDNDASYDLLEKHLPILEKRLQKRGYTCKISITNESKKVDFVTDFLEQDLPPAGTLRRYSFDMKA